MCTIFGLGPALDVLKFEKGARSCLDHVGGPPSNLCQNLNLTLEIPNIFTSLE